MYLAAAAYDAQVHSLALHIQNIIVSDSSPARAAHHKQAPFKPRIAFFHKAVQLVFQFILGYRFQQIAVSPDLIALHRVIRAAGQKNHRHVPVITAQSADNLHPVFFLQKNIHENKIITRLPAVLILFDEILPLLKTDDLQRFPPLSHFLRQNPGDLLAFRFFVVTDSYQHEKTLPNPYRLYSKIIIAEKPCFWKFCGTNGSNTGQTVAINLATALSV